MLLNYVLGKWQLINNWVTQLYLGGLLWYVFFVLQIAVQDHFRC